MTEEFKEYLEYTNFEKYLKKLNRKLKNKKIIIYGAGSFFHYIKDNYDLSNLNVIGISDMKFDLEEEGKDYLGYKIVPKSKMKEYNADCILVAVLKYINVIEDFELNIFKGTKTRVYPMTRIPFWDLVKTIFFGN